jgi:hypothetical protein
MTYADVMADIATFYFDLTATVHAAPLRAILELVPVSHLLMGFDFPIRPDPIRFGGTTGSEAVTSSADSRES